MNDLKVRLQWVINSGVTADMTGSDARYIRFINATLLLFGSAQLPILFLLISLDMILPLGINLIALVLFGLGFMINRSGRTLLAKLLITSVMTANTAYFAILLGSSAPTHFWFMPVAVLSVLAFKPSEWRWALLLISGAMISFAMFEFYGSGLEPLLRQFTNSADELQAAHGSTIAAMLLTLVLIGMMHRRFAWSETALAKEKAQSDRLLRAILPDDIARQLRETGTTPAIRHEDVSLLFADIVGFTPLAASMPAEEVVALLAEVFKRVDQLIERCGVEKIKTIGDAYMIAGGVPETSIDHAERLGRCAFGMLEIIKDVSAETGHSLQLRIGLHRGPAVAGVIGTTKFAYDLWGESVNLASRIESSGEPGRVHVSEEFMRLGTENMVFEERGEVTLKGVGRTRTHWLISV